MDGFKVRDGGGARVASAEGLGVNRHAPVVFRDSGGVGHEDELDILGQDVIDVMGVFRGEDQEAMTAGRLGGPLGSLETVACAARRCRWRRGCPDAGVAGVTPYKAWDLDRPVWWPTRVQGL